MEILKLTKRENNVCHRARKDRRAGLIPGVIYGEEIGNVSIDINAIELDKQLHISGEHGIVKFEFNGKQGNAVIKEVQKEPVGHKVIHIDLEEISDNYKMHTEVAIRLEGKGLLEGKALIYQGQKDFVKVACTAKDLPKELVLDISDAKAGSVYTISDLKIADTVSVDEDITGVIGSVIQEEREEEEDEETTTTATTEL